jgi:sugar O-acyltransferase (sialic acid O-acetyltransferase NeuD family)
MSKPKLILVGGGGHCKACIDVIEQEGKYNIIGILDLPDKQGEKILNYKIIGSDSDCEIYHQQGCEFLITVGQIKSANIRKNIFEKLNALSVNIATVISPRAYISRYAMIGKGTIVMHNAFINAGVSIGENCILNSSCNIEHDAVIGTHCHISTGAFVNGDCKLGNEVFIGSNATVSNQVNIGSNVIVGAGTLVIENISDNQTVLGVPAKSLNEK